MPGVLCQTLLREANQLCQCFLRLGVHSCNMHAMLMLELLAAFLNSSLIRLLLFSTGVGGSLLFVLIGGKYDKCTIYLFYFSQNRGQNLEMLSQWIQSNNYPTISIQLTATVNDSKLKDNYSTSRENVWPATQSRSRRWKSKSEPVISKNKHF